MTTMIENLGRKSINLGQFENTTKKFDLESLREIIKSEQYNVYAEEVINSYKTEVSNLIEKGEKDFIDKAEERRLINLNELLDKGKFIEFDIKGKKTNYFICKK